MVVGVEHRFGSIHRDKGVTVFSGEEEEGEKQTLDRETETGTERQRATRQSLTLQEQV
jgi:hypothetical protein